MSDKDVHDRDPGLAHEALLRAIAADADDFDHPTYEALEALVDGTLTAADAEVIGSHVADCATCREDVSDLEAVRRSIRIAPSAPSAPLRAPTWRRPVLAAAGLAASIAIGVAVWPRERPGPAGPPRETAQVAPSPGPTASAPTSAPDDTAGRGAATADVPALDVLTPDERDLVSRVTAARRLDWPDDLTSLQGRTGTLLGPASAPTPLAPIEPVGTVVATERPSFSWQPMAGATSYSVAIFDEHFDEVARADRLSSPRWSPTADLPRGRVLAWQVTAHLPDRDVLSPIPPQPEARFRVAAAELAAAIDDRRARLSRRPLVLAIVLAHAGLVAEARQELERALLDPADADVARALLADETLR